VASNPKFVRAVERSVTEGTFIHCYLDCGHLITVLKKEFTNTLPPAIECWACEQEEQKTWVD
jgi:hypothetical protein